MKKSILNIGKVLNKNEQKQVNGGTGNCGGYASYAICEAAGCPLNHTCERYHCNRQTSGWFCIDNGNSQ